MELNLKNKSVLVVGASKGIGKAIALGFAAEGSKLVIIARSKDIIEGVKKECLKVGAASCEAMVADITKEPRKVAETCLKKFESFDVVVHCVGTSLVPRDIFGSEEDYLTALNENALASIQMNAVLIPDMISKGIKGHVVHVSSISAINLRGNPLYASSKAFLNAYVTSAGRQVAPKGICLNSVMPGAVTFPGGYWDAAIQAKEPKVQDFLSHHQAVGRFGEADEIANLVLFLASDKSSFIVASNLPIDGGAM
jgi:3-oxoacyl-[acyl-carrier protein] reductase